MLEVNLFDFEFIHTEKILGYNKGEFFDKRGIIIFDTIEELDVILSNLTKVNYLERLPYSQKNMELSKKYISTDGTVGEILSKL